MDLRGTRFCFQNLILRYEIVKSESEYMYFNILERIKLAK